MIKNGANLVHIPINLYVPLLQVTTETDVDVNMYLCPSLFHQKRLIGPY